MPILSRRLLPVLQLTRMALVFTAIADSVTTLLLRARWTQSGADVHVWGVGLPADRVALVAVVSSALYGYGVSLNDIIDRRRDQQMAADRPLPSGRIGVRAAHVVCAMLSGVALAAGAAYGFTRGGDPFSLLLVMWTLLLITFYNFAGKYLVAPGLLTLGAVRFFHAAVPSPSLPLLWHPLLLMTHVALVSAVGYAWEQKRPPLTRGHWYGVVGGVLAADATLVLAFFFRRGGGEMDWRAFADVTWVTPGLLLPVAAAAGFALVAIAVARTSETFRDAGQRLTLAGVLWLIVYDAAFVAGYVSVAWAAVIVALLPVAYLSVRMLSWWGQLAALTRVPEFRRAER